MTCSRALTPTQALLSDAVSQSLDLSGVRLLQIKMATQSYGCVCVCVVYKHRDSVWCVLHTHIQTPPLQAQPNWKCLSLICFIRKRSHIQTAQLAASFMPRLNIHAAHQGSPLHIPVTLGQHVAKLLFINYHRLVNYKHLPGHKWAPTHKHTQTHTVTYTWMFTCT